VKNRLQQEDEKRTEEQVDDWARSSAACGRSQAYNSSERVSSRSVS